MLDQKILSTGERQIKKETIEERCLKVKAYASLRETLGCEEMEVDLPGVDESTLEELVKRILCKGRKET